jgi:predicted dehydrogenase
MSAEQPGLTRREFIGATAGATLVSAASLSAASATRIQGANDRVRLGLIGSGSRGRQVAGFVLKHPDAQYLAVADVFQNNVDAAVKVFEGSQAGVKVDTYGDYKKILERKDIDAVHIATPDHWHCQIVVEAIEAGKDVYVEKPLSNNVEEMVKALQAYRKSNRVVQVGTQQRSGQHFQEACEIVQSGQLGKINQAVCCYPGSGYGRGVEQPAEPPAGLNWEMFEGPAGKHAFTPGRHRSWRGYWDYGGGLITDWGVHLTDIALWYLQNQSSGPLMTVALGQYVNLVNPEHTQSPDTFLVTWQYPNFLMSFTNAVPSDPDFGRQGNYFFGQRGTLQVHRGGYEIRPNRQGGPGGGRGGRGAGAGGPGGAGAQASAGAAGAPGAAQAPAAPAAPPLEYKRVPYAENYADDPHTTAHARNFLDCVKSRQTPVSNLEVGFYATLPTILGVMALREQRPYKWDDKELKATKV